MTKLEKECRMWAIIAEIKGMEAENTWRIENGQGVNYGMECFAQRSEALLELSKEPELT